MTKTVTGLASEDGIRELAKVNTADDLADWIGYYAHDRPREEKQYKKITIDVHIEE
jgi:hypothetical protein